MITFLSIIFATISFIYAEIEPPNVDRYFMNPICVKLLQKQIDQELHASLVYLNMASYFSSNNIARAGFAKYFYKASDEENKHARKIIKYVTERGSYVSRFDVQMPNQDTWEDAKSALVYALQLETIIAGEIIKIHYKAEHECKDPHLMNFLEEEFINEQYKSIDELKRLVTRISKMDNGLGEYHLDKDLLTRDEL